MDFEQAYKALNAQQKKAADIIDGPVMVVAGPGTGKTQLLATRAANILKKDSTLLPTNILCLTFSDSGQVAMQRRLIELMGETGAHIAVHTFHSFGTEIINTYPQYFYQGANFSPADELTTHEIISDILQDLPAKNPLATKNQDEFIYLKAIKGRIEDLKKNALEPNELRALCVDSLKFVDFIEPELVKVFDVAKFSQTSDIKRAVELLDYATKHQQPKLAVPTFKPLSLVFMDTFTKAVEAAVELNKTKPLNDWKHDWFAKDKRGRGICKQRQILDKLLALSEVYELYQQELAKRKLFDFTDMIMRAVHNLETCPDLAYELQEQYQYFLVDEFQDTNAGQLRLLAALANHPVNEGRPNVMVVGDDDQAIYAFQGAELSNILGFRDAYKNVVTIPLKDNYRSSQKILDLSRQIIKQGSERLENYVADLDKTLAARNEPPATKLTRQLFNTQAHEYEWVASEIDNLIASGHEPKEIAVICAEHKYLEALLPYLADKNIPVNYEHRQDALNQPQIQELIALARLVDYLSRQDLDSANGMLPQVLSADYWQLPATVIWQLSLVANKHYKQTGQEAYWLELMQSGKFGSNLKQIANFLLEAARYCRTHSLEETLDLLVGNEDNGFINQADEEADIPAAQPKASFVSPFKACYFANDLLAQRPDKFIALLSSLAAIRNQLRQYRADTKLTLSDFVYFVDLCAQASVTIDVSGLHGASEDSIRLLTAHGSKGLEFRSVFILSTTAKVWDKKSQGNLLPLPPNLLTIARKNNPDDRLRLFYVALTRTKQNLYITSYLSGDDGKDVASFGAIEDPAVTALLPSPTEAYIMPDSAVSRLNRVERQWYDRHYSMPIHNMRQLLAERLENYQLSITHLNNFLNVADGGPLKFLLGNLLQFPSAMSSSAAFGSAIHATLDYVHKTVNQQAKLPSRQAVWGYFESALKLKRLNDKDEKLYWQKGQAALNQFLAQRGQAIRTNQLSELNFGQQGVMVGKARLTGRLDILEIAKTKAKVMDYKTGKDLHSWDPRGKTAYERIKLHQYRQQLLFYKLLVEGSRSWGDKGIKLNSAELVFVEPNSDGLISVLDLSLDNPEELLRLQKLIKAVWQRIITLDFPDVSGYEPTQKGIAEFEDWLIRR
jgi:DNA helicase-2/ATP-dependent DNA helicase PcrA